MTDYQSRVDEWSSYTEAEYGLSGLHARIIAASLIPTGKEWPFWLCCDSPRHRFWFDLSKVLRHMNLDPITTTWDLFNLRPRDSAHVWMRMENQRATPRLITNDWHPPTAPKPHHKSLFYRINAQFLPLRVPLPVAHAPSVDAVMELERLLRRVIDDAGRKFTPVPMVMNSALQNYITLVSKLNPAFQVDTNALALNCAILPPAHACMVGRDRVGDQDQLALLHVLHSCVPQRVTKILGCFLDIGKGDTWKLEQLVETCRLSKEIVMEVCDQLAWEQVLDWPKPKGKGNRRQWIRINDYWAEELRGFWDGSGRWW